MFVVSDPVTIIYYPDTTANSVMALFEGYTLNEGAQLNIGTGWISISATLDSDVLYFMLYRDTDSDPLLIRFGLTGPSILAKYIDDSLNS